MKFCNFKFINFAQQQKIHNSKTVAHNATEWSTSFRQSLLYRKPGRLLGAKTGTVCLLTNRFAANAIC